MNNPGPAPFRICASVQAIPWEALQSGAVTLEGMWRVTVWLYDGSGNMSFDDNPTQGLSPTMDSYGTFPGSTILRVGGAMAGERPVLLSGQWRYYSRRGAESTGTSGLIVLTEWINWEP